MVMGSVFGGFMLTWLYVNVISDRIHAFVGYYLA